MYAMDNWSVFYSMGSLVIVLQYDIIGHSGEDYSVSLTSASSPPANNKHRLQVLQTMHAHSQFCLSGDFTLKATRNAIEEVSEDLF